jgi:hypothetical protein
MFRLDFGLVICGYLGDLRVLLYGRPWILKSISILFYECLRIGISTRKYPQYPQTDEGIQL